MKHLLTTLIAIFLLALPALHAQETYTVEGETYTLLTETEGSLTLLWNTIDDEYRYFAKKGNTVVELKNTKMEGTYQEEYKESLQVLTSDENVAVADVKLTLPDLKRFFDTYNKLKNPNYVVDDNKVQITTRLGAFAGISNNVYFINPDNTSLPQLGIEFEVTDEQMLKRHAVVLQFSQLFASDSYDFSSSQFSLNYRFKFIKSAAIDVYVNTRFVSYINISRDVDFEGENFSGSGGDLRVPGSFGLGADIALGKGFITLAYTDIVSVGLENNGEFPLDLAVGYKINL